MRSGHVFRQLEEGCARRMDGGGVSHSEGPWIVDELQLRQSAFHIQAGVLDCYLARISISRDFYMRRIPMYISKLINE